MVLVLCLSITGIFTVYKFSRHDEADWKLDHNELLPAIAHYDSNRDLKPVVEIVT
jgi:hypothetical protein